jgi:hypothetical protein
MGLKETKEATNTLSQVQQVTIIISPRGQYIIPATVNDNNKSQRTIFLNEMISREVTGFHTPASSSPSVCCCLRLSAARSSKAALSSAVLGDLVPRDSSPPPPSDLPPDDGKECVVEAGGSDGARTGAGPPPSLPLPFPPPPPLPVSQALGPLAEPKVINPILCTKLLKHPPSSRFSHFLT